MNNLLNSAGNHTIPEVREDSVDDFGISNSAIKIPVPPQLARFNNIEELWSEEQTPPRQEKETKPLLLKKKDNGFMGREEGFEDEDNPVRRKKIEEERKRRKE